MAVGTRERIMVHGLVQGGVVVRTEVEFKSPAQAAMALPRDVPIDSFVFVERDRQSSPVYSAHTPEYRALVRDVAEGPAWQL